MKTISDCSPMPTRHNDPDTQGFFGDFGGQYIPDAVKDMLNEITEAYMRYRDDPQFQAELAYYFANYSGRPTPIFRCDNLSARLGGARIYLKREDLNHLGAHKVTNTLGQILLAKRMGKKRVVAETGAGQHGVATAATAALMGMSCTVFMGEEDMERQKLNVFRMRMMGAEVKPALSGQRTLKEAVDEAIGAWIADKGDTYYLLGSAVGPHPYPLMVRDFQSIIGREARAQMLDTEKKLPDAVVACVGGGSNAIGIFHEFVPDTSVRLIGVEPGGRGVKLGEHAATMCHGSVGVLHGFKSYVLFDHDGEIAPVHSISAGLDYPGIGPLHANLAAQGRTEVFAVTDTQAVNATFELTLLEGIIPALESAHALAVLGLKKFEPEEVVVITVSGRGDKDMETYIDLFQRKSSQQCVVRDSITQLGR